MAIRVANTEAEYLHCCCFFTYLPISITAGLTGAALLWDKTLKITNGHVKHAHIYLFFCHWIHIIFFLLFFIFYQRAYPDCTLGQGHIANTEDTKVMSVLF